MGQGISSHAVCVAILALAPWSEESFLWPLWVSSHIGEDFCKYQARSHVANPWSDDYHLCFVNISHNCYFILVRGGSPQLILTCLLFSGGPCGSFWFSGAVLALIVPRKCLFCHAEGHEEGAACPWPPALPVVVFSLCACVLLSVTDT